MSKSKVSALAAALLLSISGHGKSIKMDEIIFSFLVTHVHKVKSDLKRSDNYTEISLQAKVTKIQKGKIQEMVGDYVNFRPYIYSGPILSKPLGLWVGVTSEEATPKVGEIWTAYCSGLDSDRYSVGQLLKGLGSNCRVVLANPPRPKINQSLFNQIENGWTLEKVSEEMGVPTRVSGNVWQYYERRGPNAGEQLMIYEIYFKDGKVNSKNVVSGPSATGPG